MDENKNRDEALFKALDKGKKKKRIKRIITVLIIVAVIAVALIIAVNRLQAKVRDAVSAQTDKVLTWAVTTGSVSTTVSGEGAISDVDTEDITIPDSVELDEILVDPNTPVSKGDVLATVDMNTVTAALADVQDQISEKDKDLAKASSETAATIIKAGVSGRVKIIYAQPGDDIAACMVEHGALAVISQDKYMCVSIPAGELSVGDSLKVIRENGSELSGRVESTALGNAVILVPDKDAMPGEHVTVLDKDDVELGKADLEIHNPIKVTGHTGVISAVQAKLNQQAGTNTVLFRIKDASTASKYSSILKERRDLEDTLAALLTIYRDGAVRAPFDGTVLTIEDGDESDSSAQTSSQDTSSTMGMFAMGMGDFSAFGQGTAPAASSASSPSDSSSDSNEKKILTMSRDEQMSVKFPVDESDILALEVGQEAVVTIDSIGVGEYGGVLTEIDRTASSKSGVTSYSATVTFDKGEFMLSGMTAKVIITISDTGDVLIVPTDAVNKTSASAYVYTASDPVTGQLLNPVTVSCGVSNDDYTEIRSGLSAGDIIYYTKANNNFWDMYGFGGSGSSSGFGY
ncbi:MAG: hypothetical protein IJJ22_02815 [Oscillospiraceae bacterium]|nr:hypothetical protein [Oscillospiraceae bacterium]